MMKKKNAKLVVIRIVATSRIEEGMCGYISKITSLT